MRTCSGRHRQFWKYDPTFGKPGAGKPVGGILSGPERDICLDNMQKKTGAPGLYGCHGYGTQRWEWSSTSRLRSTQHSDDRGGVCVGFQPDANIFQCLPNDPDFTWVWHGKTLRPLSDSTACLEATDAGEAHVRACVEDKMNQLWAFEKNPHYMAGG